MHVGCCALLAQGNCCYCCLSEEAKVGRVLEKFSPAPVSQAKDGMLQKLVGRVVLAGTQPFYAPGSGRPCVWYRVEVFEERIRIREERDAEGNVRIVRENYWQTICKVRAVLRDHVRRHVCTCLLAAAPPPAACSECGPRVSHFARLCHRAG